MMTTGRFALPLSLLVCGAALLAAAGCGRSHSPGGSADPEAGGGADAGPMGEEPDPPVIDAGIVTTDAGAAPVPGGGGCPDPDDPRVHYVAEDCRDIHLSCEDHQTLFSNECGCGCVDDCPDPDNPRVHYAAEDPSECERIDFACSEDQTHFTGACGCGCIDDEPSSGEACAGRTETECTASASCTPGYAGFCDCTCPGPEGYEAGGCEGCPPSCFDYEACTDEASCPDPDDPRVALVGDSPEDCETIFFECDEGDIPFDGECGCGCILPES